MLQRLLTVIVIALAATSALDLAAQSGVSKIDRDLYKQILADIRRDLEKNYYDPAFRGVDLEEVFHDASGKVAAATSTTEVIDVITNMLFQFGDSHTRFYPPARATRAEYGWTMAAVGHEALVTRVDPLSDAAARGLAPGDRVLALNRFRPTRANLWQIRHYYGVVRPQAQQHVIVQKPDGSERALDIKSKVERRQVVQITDALDEFVHEIVAGWDVACPVEPAILVWRMASFREPGAISPFISQARNAKTLVLDLRGNPGGSLSGAKALIGWLFDREVPVMTRIGRKGEERETAKPKSKPFLGRLLVLVDSGSASASEVVARVVQLEKRGTVIGDRSAGAVMLSTMFGHSFGIGNITFYGTSVTVSDVRMPDGGRLENTGVMPDELLLPTPADLAAGRDPVLARALALAGASLTPEQAGKLCSGK